LTREGSEKGCWQASVTAEGLAWPRGRNKRPQPVTDAAGRRQQKGACGHEPMQATSARWQ